MTYEPKDQAAYEQVLRAFRCAESPDELRTLTVMFGLDMSYPRQDLMMALKTVEKEKGF